jgi:hypothetical protein
MAGKANDVPLRSHDILFVPNSRTRSMAAKLIEAAVTAGTGVAIWRAGQ